MSQMPPLIIDTPPSCMSQRDGLTTQAAKGSGSISLQEAVILVPKPSTPGNELPVWYISPYGGTAAAQLGTAAAAILWWAAPSHRVTLDSKCLPTRWHVQNQTVINVIKISITTLMYLFKLHEEKFSSLIGGCSGREHPFQKEREHFRGQQIIINTFNVVRGYIYLIVRIYWGRFIEAASFVEPLSICFIWQDPYFLSCIHPVSDLNWAHILWKWGFYFFKKSLIIIGIYLYSIMTSTEIHWKV